MRKVLIALGLVLIGVLVWFALRPVETEAPPTDPVAAEPAPARERTRRPRRPRKPEPAEPAEEETQPEPAAPEPVVETVAPEEAGSVLRVIDAATEQPFVGMDVHFLAIDPTDPEIAGVRVEDPHAYVVEKGRTFRTDVKGEVTLPKFPIIAVAVARDATRSGLIVLQQEPPAGGEPWVLRLSPTVRLQVRVVDESGALVPGIGVALMSASEWGEWEVASAETAAETGTATLTMVHPNEPDEVENVYHVTVKGPFEERPTVKVDLEKIPREAVELILPATGTVLVFAEGVDAASSAGQLVTISKAGGEQDHAFGFRPDGRWSSSSFEPGGTRFTVGLGLELEVTLASPDASRATVRERIAGPTEPGQEIRVEMSLGSTRPILTGRLVDSDGQPVAGQNLLAETLEPGDASGDNMQQLQGRTDDEGRFRFAVDLQPGRIPGVKLRLGRRISRREGSFSDRSFATLDLPDVLGPGTTDLGDVLFEGQTVLLSGKVVGPDGTPVAGATVQAMEVEPRMRSPEDDVDAVTTDAEGRFEVRGMIEGDEVALGISAKGCYVDKSPVFTRGARDVTVTLSEAAGLAGSVHIPDGMSPWDVNVVVQGEAIRNHDTGHRFGWGDGADMDVTLDAKGRFETRVLRPGKATVSVRLGHNEDDEVLEVAGLVVTAGEINRDPRLQEIDLEKGSAEITVRATDRDGQPVPDAVVHYRKHGEDSYWRDESANEEGVASLRVRDAALDLIVTAKGYRAESRDSVREDLTFVLNPVPVSAVTVRLAAGSTLPEPPYELEVELEWLGFEPGERDHHGFYDDPRAPTDRRDLRIGKSREVTIDAWEPGRYRVTFTLWKMHMSGGGGSGVATIPEEVTFTLRGDGAPATVELAMDDDEYRGRLARDKD